MGPTFAQSAVCVRRAGAHQAITRNVKLSSVIFAMFVWSGGGKEQGNGLRFAMRLVTKIESLGK